MSFGPPIGGAQGFAGYSNGSMGTGSVCGIVFAVMAVIALFVILAVVLKSNNKRPSNFRHAEKSTSKSNKPNKTSLVEKPKVPVPYQYQKENQAKAKTAASSQTVQKLREQHALVGTSHDPAMNMQYSGGFKNKDKPNGEWLFQTLEPNHPETQKQKSKKAVPSAPAMPHPEFLYN